MSDTRPAPRPPATQPSLLDQLLSSDFGRLHPDRAREIAARHTREPQLEPADDRR